MAVKKTAAKKKEAAKKRGSRPRRGPTGRAKRASTRSATTSAGVGDLAFRAPLMAAPTNPVYPPRDYEEVAELTLDAWRELGDDLPIRTATTDEMEESLSHSKALQKDEELYGRALAKACAARVFYDDRTWRTCLAIHEVVQGLASQQPRLKERFAFLADFIRSQSKGSRKSGTAIVPTIEDVNNG